MRDEELILRFFGFYMGGLDSYRTPQKLWLNDVADMGKSYSERRIGSWRRDGWVPSTIVFGYSSRGSASVDCRSSAEERSTEL